LKHSSNKRDISYKIGLTGPIGAGKSTVARVWESLGAVIVEGDQIGRLALLSPTLIQRLTARYGNGIIDTDDGSIDRKALSQAAFSTASGRKDLISITFPELYRLAAEHFQAAAKTGKMVVFDAALIYEWGVESDFNHVIVVTASVEKIILNATNNLNTTAAEVHNRLKAQLPVAEKIFRADRVIINDGDLDKLKKEAAIVWDELLERA